MMSFSNASYKKKLFAGTIWSLIDNFSRQALSFIIFIILARLLQPSAFGLLSVGFIIILLFKSIIHDSIALAIIRKANPTDLEYNTAFWLCIFISLPAFVFVYLFSNVIEQIIDADGLAGILKSLSIIIFSIGLSRMHEAKLAHALKFKQLALRSFVSVLIGGIVGIILAYNGFGVVSIVYQQLCTALIEVILLWIITSWKPKFEFSKQHAVEILNFSKHISLTAITNAANQNSDIFFVTYYLGAYKAGVYSTGKRITNMLNLVISSALLRVSMPAFSNLQGDNDELKLAFLKSTMLTSLILAPLFIGIAVLSKDITLLILGDKWIEAVPVMQIITVIGFLTAVSHYNQNIILIKNKPQWQTNLSLISVITNIISFVIFTRYGIVYTAIAYFAKSLLLFPISVWCAITLLDIKWKDYFNTIIPPVISAGLMALCLIAVTGYTEDLNILIRIIAFVIFGIIIYTICLYTLTGKKDRSLLMAYLKIIGKKLKNYEVN